jgi:N6-adenosine-specific RNA methylase IME4
MPKSKPFGCIVADPAWKFGDKLPGKGRGAAKHYSCMTVSEIMRYPLPPLMDSCWLFLWRVAAMQQEAFDVARAWGFTVKSEIVWVKTKNKPSCNTVRIGMGRTVRNAHEVCLVCTRGKPIVYDHSVSSVIFAPRLTHSEKPEELQDKAEKLAGSVLKIELFARRYRPGWACVGDELQAAEAAE